jgi:signal peptidase I
VTLKPLSIAAWGIGLLACAAAWSVLAPIAMLGSTAYLSAVGNSMLPYLRGGDLVAVRAADSYQVGDVVAYHNPILDNQLVLHRVVGFDGTRFVMKGDHNTWLDEYHPAMHDIVGKEWFHVDGIGDIIGRLRAPANGAALFGVAGLFAMGVPKSLSDWVLGQSRRQRGRLAGGKRRKAGGSPPPELVTSAGVGLAITSVAFIACASLFAYAWNQPLKVQRGVPAPYTQVANYSWSGIAPKGAVYPSGTFTTGDPVFLKLAGKMRVRFTYLITSTYPVVASGTTTMTATVESTQNGWKRSVTLAPETPFTGNHVEVGGTLDVAQMLAMARAYQRAVGLQADNLELTVVAHVKLRGSVGGAAIVDELAPKLPFNLDPTVLNFDSTAQPDLGAAGQAAQALPALLGSGGPSTAADRMQVILNPTLAGSVVAAVRVPNKIGAFGVSIVVTNILNWTWAGLWVFGVVSLLLFGFLIWALRGRDEAALIARRYGAHLVPVGAIAALRNDGAIEVTSMASLVRLAERADRMILHEVASSEHWYAVQDGELFYFYRTRDGASDPSVVPPSPTSAGVG